jgi:hypothetical protein
MHTRMLMHVLIRMIPFVIFRVLRSQAYMHVLRAYSPSIYHLHMHVPRAYTPTIYADNSAWCALMRVKDQHIGESGLKTERTGDEKEGY